MAAPSEAAVRYEDADTASSFASDVIAGLTARLGGRASAGRSPEGGACFTITLPLI